MWTACESSVSLKPWSSTSPGIWEMHEKHARNTVGKFYVMHLNSRSVPLYLDGPVSHCFGMHTSTDSRQGMASMPKMMPNLCGLEKRHQAATVFRKHLIWIVALKRIEIDEELYVDCP